jgi:hypothetical protein
LILKLTISEPFTVTETAGDNSDLPLLEEATGGSSDGGEEVGNVADNNIEAQSEETVDGSVGEEENTPALVDSTGPASDADASEGSNWDDFQTPEASAADATATTQSETPAAEAITTTPEDNVA